MVQDILQSKALRRRRSAVLSVVSIVGAAGLLAACGSSSGSKSAGGSGGSAGASGTATLSTRQLSGVGTALVSQSGKTVYAPDQESGGKIRCTAACLSFWTPVTVDSTTKPTSPSGVTGTLATIKRSDNGQTQVTFDGRPLYTFRLDQSPGDDKGQNFQDSFGGTTFTWRAISTSGSQGGSGAGSPAPGQTGSGGYGSSGGNY